MELEVIGWVALSPKYRPSCNLLDETNITKDVIQAIVNEIRKNGYIFDETWYVCPVLNNGKYVPLDKEFIQMLMKKAYGIDDKTYQKYLKHALNEPIHGCHFIPRPITKIEWVKNESFNDLKHALLDDNFNVELIPESTLSMNTGDILRFEKEDEGEYFEVTVMSHIKGGLIELSDIANRKFNSTLDILKLISIKKPNYDETDQLEYRFEKLKGEKLIDAFEKTYGFYALHMISNSESDYFFDCVVDGVVIDKNVEHKEPKLSSPKNIPLDKKVLEKIEAKCKENLK